MWDSLIHAKAIILDRHMDQLIKTDGDGNNIIMLKITLRSL